LLSLEPSELKPLTIVLSWKRLVVYSVALVVILSTFPWVVGPPDWDGVRWVPFQDLRYSVRRVFDALANICFYIPFGLSYVRSRPSGARWLVLRAGVLALLLSASCEFYQVFSPYRYPTMTDIATNTMGALLGASLGNRLRGKPLTVAVIE